MSKSLESDCGLVQVKGKNGIKGMSVPDIEKFIALQVKDNAELKSMFDRIKKGKVEKGTKKRVVYCKFIKDHLSSAWNGLINKKPATKAPSPGRRNFPVKQKTNAILESFNRENFPFVLETGEGQEEGAVNASENEPRENIYNNNFAQPQMVAYVRPSRKKEPDPTTGKPSAAMMARINAQVRRAKKSGVNVPAFKNIRSKIIWATTFNPKVGPPKPKKKLVVADMGNRKERPIQAKLGTLKLNGKNARTITRPKFVLATGTKLSKAETKQATEFAEQISNRLSAVGLDKKNIRKILLGRYPAGNVNGIILKFNKITNGDVNVNGKVNRNLTFNKIKAIIRPVELDRAKILKNLGSPIAEQDKPVERKGGFSMIRTGPNIAELATKARAQKAANRTDADRRAIRIANAITKMKAKGKKSQPAVKMFVTTRAPNVSSSANSNSESPIAPMVMGSAGSSASSSAGSSAGKSPIKTMANLNARRMKLTEKREQKQAEKNMAKAKSVMNKKRENAKVGIENRTPKKRPVPRFVRDIKTGAVNLNKLNKAELNKMAKRVYAVIQPGKAIPFEQANKTRVVRLIRLGINKM